MSKNISSRSRLYQMSDILPNSDVATQRDIIKTVFKLPNPLKVFAEYRAKKENTNPLKVFTEYRAKKATEKENTRKLAYEIEEKIMKIISFLKSDIYLTLTKEEKELLKQNLINLKIEHENLTGIRRYFLKPQPFPSDLTQENKIIDDIIKKNPVYNTTFAKFESPAMRTPLEFSTRLNLPHVPTDTITLQSRQSRQSPKKLPVNKGETDTIPKVINSRDLADGLGVYNEELTRYIDNRYDFLIKYISFIRSFINPLKPPINSKHHVLSSFETEERDITKHMEEYSRKQEQGGSVMYSDVVYNVKLQQNHLIKLHEFFTKLFTMPKQFSNEVDYRVFQNYLTPTDLDYFKELVIVFNKEVAEKHSSFNTKLSEGKTYRDLVVLIREDLGTLNTIVDNFKNICNSFVNTITLELEKKERLQQEIEKLYKLLREQNDLYHIIIDDIDTKLKTVGGRRKPTKKPTKATMNMKDIRRLCKANQIKLSTTKDGVRIIYKKKELITKLKRRKIL